MSSKARLLAALLLIAALCAAAGCASVETRRMSLTGYCGCGKCCSWTRGHWKYLKLDIWNRTVSKGARKGRDYDGRTASGLKPRSPAPGLASWDSVKHPWMIPVRLVFFPWLLLPHDGTVAVDTAHYPFGTRFRIPDYGWGRAEDRGSAIQGPDRLDLYFGSHRKALQWGVKTRKIEIYRK